MGENSTTGSRDHSVPLPVVTTEVKLQGYHAKIIAKGEYGELSKIKEEMEEALDAECQKNPVMVLMELSDMIGGIEGYLKKHHPTVTLEHLVTMARTTQRVFESGERK